MGGVESSCPSIFKGNNWSRFFYLATQCRGTFVEESSLHNQTGRHRTGITYPVWPGSTVRFPVRSREVLMWRGRSEVFCSACCYHENTLIKYSVMCFLKCRPLCDSSATDAQQTSLFKIYYVFWFQLISEWGQPLTSRYCYKKTITKHCQVVLCNRLLSVHSFCCVYQEGEACPDKED